MTIIQEVLAGTAPPIVIEDLNESLLAQFKAEAGAEPLPKDEDFILRQKYGLVPPQLSHLDRNFILQEGMRLAKNPNYYEDKYAGLLR